VEVGGHSYIRTHWCPEVSTTVPTELRLKEVGVEEHRLCGRSTETEAKKAMWLNDGLHVRLHPLMPIHVWL
jgi:hypothetical protein